MLKMNKIKVYVKPSCSSSRKAVQFFIDNNIEFTKVEINKEFPSFEDFKSMLKLTPVGVEDLIIRGKAKHFQLDGDMEHLTLNEVYNLLAETPKLLKTPLITEEQAVRVTSYLTKQRYTMKKLRIGYNEDQMGAFIPRNRKGRMYQDILQVV